MILYMIPVYLDIFILTAAIGFDKVSFSSMIIPRKRASVTRVTRVPAMLTQVFEYSIFLWLYMSCSEFFEI